MNNILFRILFENSLLSAIYRYKISDDLFKHTFYYSKVKKTSGKHTPTLVKTFLTVVILMGTFMLFWFLVHCYKIMHGLKFINEAI